MNEEALKETLRGKKKEELIKMLITAGDRFANFSNIAAGLRIRKEIYKFIAIISVIINIILVTV